LCGIIIMSIGKSDGVMTILQLATLPIENRL
jgi:hypothetical protein